MKLVSVYTLCPMEVIAILYTRPNTIYYPQTFIKVPQRNNIPELLLPVTLITVLQLTVAQKGGRGGGGEFINMPNAKA